MKFSIKDFFIFCAVYVCETCLQIYKVDHLHVNENEINSLYSDSVEI